MPLFSAHVADNLKYAISQIFIPLLVIFVTQDFLFILNAVQFLSFLKNVCVSFISRLLSYSVLWEGAF